ncbi:MAG: Gfo/Idh/MocA family oxidoreductase [Lachnospiraceae bacterium]|nr:Gfo/Idh/MocA family oxidoreductase [Lachnospiraceae bacterium]
MKKVKIGILGLGAISGIYLKNLTELFREVEIEGVYDLISEKTEAVKQEYNIPKGYRSMEEMLQDPEIDMVLNLTRPFEHYDTTKAALLAGKHVYSEKPLAATFEEGKELAALAQEMGLLLGGAPDTFLGAGIQTCRKLIDDGFIGRPIGASAQMICHGHEGWHPSPAFYYQFGGGPMMDMGPYYLTALVNLLGGVKELTGMTTKSFETRTITSQPLYGQVVDVEVPTHVNGIMRFASGAIGTITTTFDVHYDRQASLEIYGTQGTLRVPDPNGFGGPIQLLRPEDGTFREIPLTFDYKENSRGLGLADMAKALQTGRRVRADYTQTLHVLEIMTAFEKSSREGKTIRLETAYERGPAMRNDTIRGVLD